MALPRSRSRLVVVDAVEYRYAISRASSHDAGLFPLNLTIQLGTGRGRLLKAQGLSTRDAWLDVSDDRAASAPTAVTPPQVARIVRFARSRGWIPEQEGAPFVLRIAPDASS